MAAAIRKLSPVRVRRWSEALSCDVRRVVGYQARCDACDWRSRTCSTIRIARLALDMHKLAEHR